MQTPAERVTEETEKIYSKLVANPLANKLPERLFVENFLPYFCGEVEIPEETELYSLWYGIAGSPTGEVDIIDISGKSLYKVPPLMNTNIINPKRGDNNDMNFSQIIALASMYNNMTPVAGLNALNTGLANKLETLRNKSVEFTDYEIRWIDIFKRYGKIKQNTVSSVAVADNRLQEDEMEF